MREYSRWSGLPTDVEPSWSTGRRAQQPSFRPFSVHQIHIGRIPGGTAVHSVLRCLQGLRARVEASMNARKTPTLRW
jgi:hypothetical protein